MRGILSFVVVLAALFDTGHCANYNLNPITGHSYRVLKDQKRTWNDAKLKCQSEGAELASIRTAQEWQFVKDLIVNSGVDLHVHLGGTDVKQEGKWLWTDGSPVSNISWIPGFPMKRNYNNCMMANKDKSWNWYDYDCGVSLYALCKKPAGYLTDSSTGNSYKVLQDQKRTWIGARLKCESEGAELVSFKTSQEWKFVKGLLQGIGHSGYVWIGGSDAALEGTWVWTDGSPVKKFSDSDWYPGKPVIGTNWNCMTAWGIGSWWRWIDGFCSDTFFAVCKIPVVPVTTPPAPTCPPCPTTKPVDCSNGYSNSYIDSNKGHAYKYKVLNDALRTWYEAKSECEAQGAELASIRSSQEWIFVKDVIKQSGVEEYLWLGGTDAQEENNFVWTDGSPVSFTDWITTWGANPPTGLDFLNCIGAHKELDWHWFDGKCSVKQCYGLCKIRA